MHGRQIIYPTVTQPDITWRQGGWLDAPNLTSPRDGANVCGENYGTVIGGDSGIHLRWTQIVAADFYVVQWCNNGSFTGPTLKAVGVAQPAIQYSLKLGDDIRKGDTVYWRVMAYTSDGSISNKSETWNFTYDCVDDPGGASGGESKQYASLCEQYNVSIKIDGPNKLFCCDKVMYHLQSSFKCKDGNGADVLTEISAEWSLETSPEDPTAAEITQANVKNAVVETKGSASQVFKVIHTKTFLTAGGQTFTCRGEHRVEIDCATGYSRYKPWLQIAYAGNYLQIYRHPDYVGYNIGTHYHLQPSYALPSAYTRILDWNGPNGHVIALGPIIQVQAYALPRVTDNTKCGRQQAGIDIGYALGVVDQARVHIPLGYGLRPVYSITPSGGSPYSWIETYPFTHVVRGILLGYLQRGSFAAPTHEWMQIWRRDRGVVGWVPTSEYVEVYETGILCVGKKVYPNTQISASAIRDEEGTVVWCLSDADASGIY